MVKALLIILILAACSLPSETAEQLVAEEATTTTVLETTTTTTQVTTTVPETTTTTVPPTMTTPLPPKPELPEAVVGGLVVSMGEPPTSVVERYADFGGNVVMLWEPEEAKYWADYPAIVWVTEDGQQVNDPLRKDEPDQAPLELAYNVVAVQVGDEPWPISMEGAEGYRAVPERLGLPVSEYTNFSYWTPLTAGVSNMEPSLDKMIARYQGDRIMVSEYNLRNEWNIRYLVLDYFRQQALKKGIDYWQYLNAYSGYETEMQLVHSPSDMAWTAFSGATIGYTGHIWFSYQFSLEGHAEAIQGGGSVFYEGPGNWTETPMWEETARVNKGLLAMSEKVAQMTSTGVSWRGSQFGSDEPLLVGSFVKADGSEVWAIMNSNHTYAGSDDQATVTIPFDAEVWDAVTQSTILVVAGESVTIPAGWAVLISRA